MAYIKCSFCGCFVEEGLSFCPECGHKLEYSSSKRVIKRSSVGWIIALIILISLGIAGKWQYDVYNYGINLHNAAYYIMTSSEKLEDAGIQFLSVWNNSINKIRDEETDRFTLNEAGSFFPDFNDALDLLIESKEYQSALQQAKDAQREASELMGKLINPPRRYKEAYSSIKALYTTYMAFYNTIVNPTGNYSAYSDKFEQARDSLLEAYYIVSMY